MHSIFIYLRLGSKFFFNYLLVIYVMYMLVNIYRYNFSGIFVLSQIFWLELNQIIKYLFFLLKVSKFWSESKLLCSISLKCKKLFFNNLCKILLLECCSFEMWCKIRHIFCISFAYMYFNYMPRKNYLIFKSCKNLIFYVWFWAVRKILLSYSCRKCNKKKYFFE